MAGALRSLSGFRVPPTPWVTPRVDPRLIARLSRLRVRCSAIDGMSHLHTVATRLVAVNQ